MNLFQLESHLNEILNVEDFEDFCKNGIQVEGKHEIKKIALGVSYNNTFFEKIKEWNPDVILVHHGLFGKGVIDITGYKKIRIENLIKNDISLMGYHLPLDASLEYGNNSELLRKLGIEIVDKFSFGFKGRMPKKVPFQKLTKNLKEILQKNQSLLCYQNREYAENIAIVSGGGANFIEKLDPEIDTYITGSVEEHTRDIAKDMGVNFIHAGHYATETFGIKKLGDYIKNNFDLEIKYFEYYNEV
ncbi:MAG: Nif3-like dinuclear metal center hexameric protein [Thermotogota bacterium]